MSAYAGAARENASPNIAIQETRLGETGRNVRELRFGFENNTLGRRVVFVRVVSKKETSLDDYALLETVVNGSL